MIRLTRPGFLVVALLIAACGKPDQPPVPRSDGPAEFVGSVSCQSCHADAFIVWVGSKHELDMQIANADTVLGDFYDASFEYLGTTSQFFTSVDVLYVRTADA